MKKNMSKITTIVSAVFGLVFIILLICTAFGGLGAEDFDNKLVKILLIVFGGCFLLDSIAAVALQFSEHITVKEVQVAQEAGGNIKVTPGVIRNLIKRNIKTLNGIKYKRMNLILTEFGVQLNVVVAYSDGRRVEETGAFLQALITDVCKRELDLAFHTINIKVAAFRSVYIPDVAKLEADTQTALGKEPILRDDSADPVYIDADDELGEETTEPQEAEDVRPDEDFLPETEQPGKTEDFSAEDAAPATDEAETEVSVPAEEETIQLGGTVENAEVKEETEV